MLTIQKRFPHKYATVFLVRKLLVGGVYIDTFKSKKAYLIKTGLINHEMIKMTILGIHLFNFN